MLTILYIFFYSRTCESYRLHFKYLWTHATLELVSHIDYILNILGPMATLELAESYRLHFNIFGSMQLAAFTITTLSFESVKEGVSNFYSSFCLMFRSVLPCTPPPHLLYPINCRGRNSFLTPFHFFLSKPRYCCIRTALISLLKPIHPLEFVHVSINIRTPTITKYIA